MGYHDNKNIWKPTMKEKLETRMKPDNIMNKFPVAVVKSDSVVGHIMKGKTGRFAKTILYSKSSYYQGNKVFFHLSNHQSDA